MTQAIRPSKRPRSLPTAVNTHCSVRYAMLAYDSDTIMLLPADYLNATHMNGSGVDSGSWLQSCYCIIAESAKGALKDPPAVKTEQPPENQARDPAAREADDDVVPRVQPRTPEAPSGATARFCPRGQGSQPRPRAWPAIKVR